ncbi:MAG: hypothetical protein ACFFEA_14610, partial [Candidatus Thorarchaeota archaeon]
MDSSILPIRALDIGSFPIDADMPRYIEGARLIEMDPTTNSEDAVYFIDNHNEAVRLKAEAMGPNASVISFAQCRGMIAQYLEPLFIAIVGEKGVEPEKLVTKSNAQIVAAKIALDQVSLDSIPTRV